MAKLDLGGLNSFTDLMMQGSQPLPTDHVATESPKIAMALIDEDPDQPRKDFDALALQELAASIKERGLLQPVVVKPHPNQPGRYMLVAGGRRYRAHTLLGLDSIAAIIKQDSQPIDQLVENLQREDLSAKEKLGAIKRLLDDGMSQAAIAKGAGKSRTWVSRYASLLDLPAPLAQLMQRGLCNDVEALSLLAKLWKQYEDAITVFAEKQLAGNEIVTKPVVDLLQMQLVHQQKQSYTSSDGGGSVATSNSASPDNRGDREPGTSNNADGATESDPRDSSETTPPRVTDKPPANTELIAPAKKKKRIIQVKVGKNEAILLPDELCEYGLVWVEYTADGEKQCLDANKVKLVATVDVP